MLISGTSHPYSPHYKIKLAHLSPTARNLRCIKNVWKVTEHPPEDTGPKANPRWCGIVRNPNQQIPQFALFFYITAFAVIFVCDICIYIYIYIYIYACVFQGEAIDVHAIMRDEWREEARGTSTGLDCWRREFREREREPNWVLALFRKAAKRAATVVFHLFQFPDTSQTMENVLPRDGGDGHRHNSPLCHRRCNVMSANALKGPRGKCVQKAIVPPVKQVYESFF